MIRKIQFAPATNKEGPKADITKQFMMTDKPVHLEASLEKEVHWLLQMFSLIMCILIYYKYVKCKWMLINLNTFSYIDLLSQGSNHCQSKNQQRNQQGCEENQSHRWEWLKGIKFELSLFPVFVSSRRSVKESKRIRPNKAIFLSF